MKTVPIIYLTRLFRWKFSFSRLMYILLHCLCFKSSCNCYLDIIMCIPPSTK